MNENKKGEGQESALFVSLNIYISQQKLEERWSLSICYCRSEVSGSDYNITQEFSYDFVSRSPITQFIRPPTTEILHDCYPHLSLPLSNIYYYFITYLKLNPNSTTQTFLK